MKVLFIDTHLFDINIILFENNKIKRYKTIKDKKYNSPYLMPTIKDVIDDEDFDEIIIINGPGSFTGVRLGITIAKTLAYTMNKIIKPISYFDLMNISSDNEDNIFGISDNNGYFIAEYKSKKLIKDFYYLKNDEYEEFITNHNVITNVTIDYEKVIKEENTFESVNPHSVKPLYIKSIGV